MKSKMGNKIKDKSLQVYFKLNEGLWTRKVYIPKEFVTHFMEYRVPLKSGLTMHTINLAQAAFEDTKTPTLVFKANGQEKQGIYVMELLRVENI